MTITNAFEVEEERERKEKIDSMGVLPRMQRNFWKGRDLQIGGGNISIRSYEGMPSMNVSDVCTLGNLLSYEHLMRI